MIRAHKRALMVGVVRPWERRGSICSIGEDDPAGGGGPPGGAPPAGGGDPPGGGGDPPKMVPQDKVNAILADERRKYEAKLADLQEKANKVDELSRRIEEIEEEKTLAGKTAEEKERARADKERKTLLAEKDRLEAERAEYQTKLERAQEEHRMTRARHQLSLALSAAKVYPQAAGDALDAMIRDSDLEFDEETGALKGVTLSHDGGRYDDMQKAAASYLSAKPHFAAGAPGGTGTRPPNGTRAGSKALADMTPDERMKLAEEQRASRHR